MRFDSPAVLKKVLENPEVFPVAKQLDEFARKIVTAKMKSLVTVGELKQTCQALGPDMFRMAAEGLSDAEAKTIVGKVDPKNKEAKAAGGPAQRVLLVELGTGQVDPRAASIKTAPPREPSRKSGAGKAMQSTSTSAVRNPTQPKPPSLRTSVRKKA